MTTPTKDEGRAASNRATPKDTSRKPDHIAPTESAAISLRAWLIDFRLDVQRADVVVIALVLAGWPR